MINPFRNTYSPISNLYQRARIKSKQNRQCLRSPAQSYREFQVKIIRNALNNNHIIQKQYHKEHRYALQRERKCSKYLGIQSQRYTRIEQRNYQQKKRRESNFCSTGNQTAIMKKVHLIQRDSEILQTMINIQGQNLQSFNNRKLMRYSSSYDLENQIKKSSGNILIIGGRIRQSKQLQKQKTKSPQKRCSITSSIQNEGQKQYKMLTKGLSKKRIDRIKQEYFNTYYQ